MACKRPRSFSQKCRWQVTPTHAYTHDPTKSEWVDYATVQAKCGNLSRNKLALNLSRNNRPQSSHLTEPLWTDPGLRSGVSVCDLISTLKNKKKVCRTFSPNPGRQGESHGHVLVDYWLTIIIMPQAKYQSDTNNSMQHSVQSTFVRKQNMPTLTAFWFCFYSQMCICLISNLTAPYLA